MTADGGVGHAVRWGQAHLPWSPSTFRATGFIVAGVPLSLAAPAAVALSFGLFIPHKFRPGFLEESSPLAVVAAVIMAALLVLAVVPMMTAAQRWRLRSLAGVDLTVAGATPRPSARGVLAWAGRGATWRQVSYHLVVAVLLAACGLAAIGLFASGLALSTVFLWLWVLKGPYSVEAKVVYTVLGLALVVVAPWAVAAVRRLDAGAAARLLGPSRAELRLASVTESRSGLVQAADAERRRIERDLHDGAQARLVSLAMSLGLAHATRADLPDDARALIADAHDQTIKAIEELRDLVRGLHPAVLDELGLDAALSGIVAKMSLPVRLHVNMPRRVAPDIEAAAYFVVSEALANVAKHAAATRVDVTVEQLGGTLRVMVADNGVGGADPALGSGIKGLGQRVRSVDGEFRLDSPPGGPTTVSVELPCE
jgi:signal transduction histidine kinase